VQRHGTSSAGTTRGAATRATYLKLDGMRGAERSAPRVVASDAAVPSRLTHQRTSWPSNGRCAVALPPARSTSTGGDASSGKTTVYTTSAPCVCDTGCSTCVYAWPARTSVAAVADKAPPPPSWHSLPASPST
jgi:hypothetical protein